MRSSKSRSRSKSNRQRSLGNVINRVFDSSGPEGKVRGTPQQIIDKYLGLARDAQLSNDRVSEQAFLQHAEHYTRLLGEAMREQAREQEARQSQQQGNNNSGGNNGNGNGGNGNNNAENRDGNRNDGGGRSDAGRDSGGGRDRYEPRRVVEEDEQPDFAPLASLADDDGPGLVETPEMRHAAAAAPEPFQGGGERPAKNRRSAPAADRAPRAPRGPRRPKADAPAEEASAASVAVDPAGDAE